MDIAALRRDHPMPWLYVTNPNGLVRVLDARSKEVPLFTVIAFVVAITAHMGKQPA